MRDVKIAMIGIDAAELGFIQSSLASLPTLRRLLGMGVIRTLGSPADLLPGSVWPTFSTATLPGEHGIYHHLQWDATSMRLRRVSAAWLDCEPFWSKLSRLGRRVVVLDVPMTFPSRLRQGIEVTNWGSHDQLGPLTSHPASIAREIRGRFGAHPMGAEIPVAKSAGALDRICASLIAGARRKGELARWLLRKGGWDLFLVVFGETHRGGHLLWPDGDPAVHPRALREVYQAVDEAIGLVLAELSLDDTTVIVFSLHGMGPNTSQEHFVPEVMDRINARFERQPGDSSSTVQSASRPSLVRRLRERVPAGVQHAVAQRVPVFVRDLVVERSITAGHDWRRTPGLDVLSDLNGYLRFNLLGREREGSLDPAGDRFARYAAWVRECFQGLLIADSSEPVVAVVRRPAEEYPGTRVAHLPDLVVTWTGGPPVSCVRSEALGRVTAALATGRSGNHRPLGFCLVAGPQSQAGAVQHVAHIVELGPMVVASLGA